MNPPAAVDGVKRSLLFSALCRSEGEIGLLCRPHLFAECVHLTHLPFLPSPMSLLNLPPEISTLIARQVPLYDVPRAVLSLALASKELCSAFIHILHLEIVLRNETSAITFLKGVLESPEKGHDVQGLYIQSRGRRPKREGHSHLAASLASLLRDIFSRGLLPKLRAMEVHLEGEEWPRMNPAPLDDVFWKDVDLSCPILTSVSATIHNGSSTPFNPAACSGQKVRQFP